MKNRLETSPSLKSLEEGDIIQTEDGYALICVPDDQSECGKALTDGDLWMVNEDEIGTSYRLVPPTDQVELLGTQMLSVLQFVLQRAREHMATLSFRSNFYRLANYVSPN